MSYENLAGKGLYDIVQIYINSGQLRGKISVKEFIKGLITLSCKLNRTTVVNLNYG